MLQFLLFCSSILVSESYKYTRVGLVGGQRKSFPILLPSVFFSANLQDRPRQCKLPRSCAKSGLVSNAFQLSDGRRRPFSYAFAHSPYLEDAPLGSPRNSSVSSARTRIFASGFDPVPPNSLKRKSPSRFHPPCPDFFFTIHRLATLNEKRIHNMVLQVWNDNETLAYIDKEVNKAQEGNHKEIQETITHLTQSL
jgi:hypothetical protein